MFCFVIISNWKSACQIKYSVDYFFIVELIKTKQIIIKKRISLLLLFVVGIDNWGQSIYKKNRDAIVYFLKILKNFIFFRYILKIKKNIIIVH